METEQSKDYFEELTNQTDNGNQQVANLVKNWEYKQVNAVRLLREELDNLSKKHEVEHKKVEILKEQWFEQDGHGGGDNLKYEEVKTDAEVNWKQRALSLEKLLEASVGREKALMVKLQENVERQSSLVEQLSQVLERANNSENSVVLSSMWHEDMNEAGRQFNVEIPGGDNDMLEEVTINKESNIVDFKRLMELTNYSDKGNWQLANLVKNWEYKQENAVRLLREELDNLSKQQQAVELKKLEILEEHRFEQDGYGGDKRPISILDENLKYLYQDVPRRKQAVVFQDEQVKVDAEYDSVVYWKQRALSLEKLLEASVGREKALMVKLQESIENLERQSTPVEELSQVLERADNFLHFVLQNAPVVIGHQDKDLRYRFIFNHFPSLGEGDIIGKTDVEIFTGAGIKESRDFKKEVLERGIPAKREITFETELFGSKTFLLYVEPVFSNAGETLGVNYIGMEVTDQVRKREKMAKLREEMAVQKAKEIELNKIIHIQDESTMCHEIRSPPLSEVVILSSTKLDEEQAVQSNAVFESSTSKRHP